MIELIGTLVFVELIAVAVIVVGAGLEYLVPHGTLAKIADAVFRL